MAKPNRTRAVCWPYVSKWGHLRTSPLLVHLVLMCCSSSLGVSINQSSVPETSSQRSVNLPPSTQPDLQFGRSAVNCTECDMLGAEWDTLPVGAHIGSEVHRPLPPHHNGSRPSGETPSVLLKPPSQTSSVSSPDYLRYARSAVIETTLAPTLSADVAASQDSDPPSSSPMTTPSPNSTILPKTGFGDFFEIPNENYDDDEDLAAMAEKNTNEEANLARMNVGVSSSAGYDTMNAIFGDNKAEPEEPEEETDEDPIAIFERPPVSRRDRILIVSYAGSLPAYPAEGVFTMQQAIPEDFEGCYCDRHYLVTPSANSEDSVSSDNYESQQYQRQHQTQHPLSSNHSAPTDASSTREFLANGTPIQEEVSCYCFGESVTQVPQNFTPNVRKM